VHNYNEDSCDIFPLNTQTIITAQRLSTGGNAEGLTFSVFTIIQFTCTCKLYFILKSYVNYNKIIIKYTDSDVLPSVVAI